MRNALVCAALLASGAAFASRAHAQRPPVVHVVDGRVLKPLGTGESPVGGEWVTLHRVAPDSAAPLDSTRTDASGRYSFRYRPWGSDDAIYFVSARYAGIAYFTPPLRGPLVSGEQADIAVFDTSSTVPKLVVRGRHVIVSAEDSTGSRSVIEVFEISNDTSITFVPGAGDAGAFSIALPRSRRDFRVSQGDVPGESVEVRGDRAVIVAPFAPGLRQLSFSYLVDADDFPLALPVERPTAVVEVLVEDPTSRVSGARLTAVDPVNVDGRGFRRFLAQDVLGRDSIRVEVSSAGAGLGMRAFVPGLLLALGSALLVGLGLAVRRRGLAAQPARGTSDAGADAERERLARAISELDASFAREREPTGEMRAAYAARRAALKQELARALAASSDAR